MRVAEAAVAAAQQHDALARRVEVGEHGLLVVVEDLGADRHLEHHVVAPAPVRSAPAPSPPFWARKCCV